MTGENVRSVRVPVFARLAMLAALLAGLVLVSIPRSASGWVWWTGIDPLVRVGDEELSITIKWDPKDTCDIEKAIPVRVRIPQGTEAKLISESKGIFECGPIVTRTEIDYGDPDEDQPGQKDGRPGKDRGKSEQSRGRGHDSRDRDIQVSVKVPSKENFEVHVHLEWAGRPQTHSMLIGKTNQRIHGSMQLP
jgi:hypothetical protein